MHDFKQTSKIKFLQDLTSTERQLSKSGLRIEISPVTFSFERSGKNIFVPKSAVIGALFEIKRGLQRYIDRYQALCRFAADWV